MVGASVSVLEGFRELNVGTLEAQPPSTASWRLHDDIVRAWADGDADARFPEGESFNLNSGKEDPKLESS